MPGRDGRESRARSSQPASGTEDGSAAGRWRWLKPVLAVLLIGLAIFLLYRTLSRYDYDEVIGSIAAIPLSRLLLALLFAAASYLCLTFFDRLALAHVGHAPPYPKVALASFVSLSLGHNIGFAALSSGTIRYRFYSRYGLETEEIAGIILFCGVTVALGLFTMGGIALLLRPGFAEEITGFRQGEVIALGCACFIVPALYLGAAAMRLGPVRFRRWSLTMPRLPIAAGQVAIGTLNYAFVSACLHQALSGAAEVPYLNVAAVYVIATVAAIISHVPGGLGVIESVVLYLLPQEQLIGAVLVFRFVYFLLPLALGATLFAITELRLRATSRSDSERSAPIGGASAAIPAPMKE